MLTDDERDLMRWDDDGGYPLSEPDSGDQPGPRHLVMRLRSFLLLGTNKSH